MRCLTGITRTLALCVVLLPGMGRADAVTFQGANLRNAIKADYSYLDKLYRHLHQNPELSYQEKNTSRLIAQELQQLDFKVTEHVGGYGVVGVFKNGQGPTLLIRADMDALPVKEDTGLPYASTAVATEQNGLEVPVMHACGHDVHMTVLVGTARRLRALSGHWQGTLVMIAQPAEERLAGAKKMLEDGLFERFPRPDANLALHVSDQFDAGTVAFTEGYMTANVDSVNIRVFGEGGHGALPHQAKDPIVLASQIVLGLQALVAREVPALDPAVVTVGSFQAGSKHNVIPNHADLLLTVRTYSDDVRQQLLEGIERVAKGMGIAAGLPDRLLAEVKMLEEERTLSHYNDDHLSRQVKALLQERLGEERVLASDSVMGGEDFALYSRVDPPIPGLMFWLGASDPNRSDNPHMHNSGFAPLASPTIQTGVLAMSEAVLKLMRSQSERGYSAKDRSQ
ncbi:M20 metallopeptidase family protein [Pseudomaricurvus alkylphenolicus]|uniref:M20 metallopeptidase family protein n=1 Tax=Pseudomaricurvus alkylphenolicus TaxID=1306991 RepID=UPI001F0D1E5E|nr:amidohydrolase [Pseudomaricurvus alkylphenolicus]